MWDQVSCDDGDDDDDDDDDDTLHVFVEHLPFQATLGFHPNSYEYYTEIGHAPP